MTHSRRHRGPVGSLLALAGFLAFLGPLAACTNRGEPQAHGDSSAATVVIPVEGMSCAACAARVKKTLGAIEGVSRVEVSLAERHARVWFDPARVTPDRLAAAINNLDYRAGTPAVTP